MGLSGDDNYSSLPHALGFDDIVVLPGFSRVEPHEIDVSGRASKSIMLKLPLVSSPMDTVTEWRMAVALALRGGLGVIHRNLSVEDQVENAKRVKQHPPLRLTQSYIPSSAECCQALRILRRIGLRSLPLVEEYSGKVAGYLRAQDLLTCRCGESVRKYVRPGPVYGVQEALEARSRILKGEIDALAITLNGAFLGTVTVSDALEAYEPLTDEEGRLRVAAAISPFDEERAEKLSKHVDLLVSDVAHFHNSNVISAAKRIAGRIDVELVAGNIGTYEAAVDVITGIEDVAGLRVGVAGGSICTTGGVTGVAAPTLFAVLEAARALRDHGIPLDQVPIIADGGIRGAGDALKALAAGASAVMAGYMLAGTDEAPAPLIRIGDKLYKPYRGMASRSAIERRYALDRYSRTAKNVEEGIEGLVEYRGSVYKVLERFEEALKAGFGYAGARNLRELWAKARLARVTSRFGAYMGIVKTS